MQAVKPFRLDDLAIDFNSSHGQFLADISGGYYYADSSQSYNIITEKWPKTIMFLPRNWLSSPQQIQGWFFNNLGNLGKIYGQPLRSYILTSFCELNV